MERIYQTEGDPRLREEANKILADFATTPEAWPISRILLFNSHVTLALLSICSPDTHNLSHQECNFLLLTQFARRSQSIGLFRHDQGCSCI